MSGLLLLSTRADSNHLHLRPQSILDAEASSIFILISSIHLNTKFLIAIASLFTNSLKFLLFEHMHTIFEHIFHIENRYDDADDMNTENTFVVKMTIYPV